MLSCTTYKSVSAIIFIYFVVIAYIYVSTNKETSQFVDTVFHFHIHPMLAMIDPTSLCDSVFDLITTETISRVNMMSMLRSVLS